MASWSTRRKYGYFAVFIVALIIFVGVPAFFAFYKAPTCFDGIQNGKERGVDCGGACARLCPADYATPRVLWAHSVRVVPGVYNALAYVQNPNNTVEAKALPYLFKLYDDKGLLVIQRQGYAYIPAGQRIPIFEGGIATGNRVPARTTFEFTGTPNWKPALAFGKIRTLGSELQQGDKPSAQISVENSSVDQAFSNVTAFIILYDKNDNRVSFSKTVIDSIGPGEKKDLFFTWPEAFGADIVRTETLFVRAPSR